MSSLDSALSLAFVELWRLGAPTDIPCSKMLRTISEEIINGGKELLEPTGEKPKSWRVGQLRCGFFPNLGDAREVYL